VSPAVKAPRGTIDALPPESTVRRRVEAAFLGMAARYGYEPVETPIFEHTELFVRSVGESTDIVQKEMYTFADKGERSLTLRPEGTASVVRALIEHGATAGPLPVKVFYSGPMFRHERPQSGRQRQFHQVGVEALGSDDPALDAEVILLGCEAFRAAGLKGTTLLLNSMGDAACRPIYREALVEFLEGASDELCKDCRSRIAANPLRVFDCKQPGCHRAVAGAPLLREHMCGDCREHYAKVGEYLAEMGEQWEEAPRLVRGLDYYTRTTFEWQSPVLGAQNAVGGGGRYDGLSAELGGPELPGIGWAVGIDRTLLALEREGSLPAPDPAVRLYVVAVSAAAREAAFRLTQQVRRAGVATDMAFGKRSLKGNLRHADRLGAVFVALLGDRELERGVVTLRSMESGAQEEVPLEAVPARVVED